MGSRLTGEAVVQALNICALISSEEINREREREWVQGQEGKGRNREGSIKRRSEKKSHHSFLMASVLISESLATSTLFQINLKTHILLYILVAITLE